LIGRNIKNRNITSFLVFRNTLLFFLVASAFNLKADHLLGGEMVYRCLGGNQYEISIINFRDCTPGTSNWTLTRHVGVHNSAGVLVTNFSLPRILVEEIDVEATDPCFIPPPGFCMERGIYRDTIEIDVPEGGVTLSNLRCCIAPGITNMVYPTGTPEPTQVFTTFIPGPELAECNNSPQFTEIPPVFICLNQSETISYEVTDEDGDNLVYTLCEPFGGDFGGFHPNPPGPPPYGRVTWEEGFDIDNQIPGDPPFQINSETGQITVTPNAVGVYNTAICVQEWRDGVLLGTYQRDFIFNVVACQTIEAVIPEQTNNELCTGLTFTFTNESVTGENPEFFWDFGVDNDPDATSTEATPTFTFPEPGNYIVTLTINPNSACPASVSQTFTIFPELDLEIVPSNLCRNTDLSFQVEGDYALPASFNWTFENASPNSSSVANPQNINFGDADEAIVSLNVEDGNGCIKNFEETFDLFPAPVISFTSNEFEGCQPFMVDFNTTTFILNGNHNIYWDFGNGVVLPGGNNISYTYNQSGNFDISLIVATQEFCVDSVKVTQNSLITVGEVPETGFELLPKGLIQIADPLITVENTAQNAVFCSYFLNDMLIAEDCNFQYELQNSGFFTLTQIVEDEFGCTASSSKEFAVEGSYFFAPSAFTPNGDGVNDVFKPSIFDVTSYDLKIFDRNGTMIFRTLNPNEGWDGKISSQDATAGVYLYVVEYVTSLGFRKNEQGAFTLVK
jgi:gliding motility-associated-like protein